MLLLGNLGTDEDKEAKHKQGYEIKVKRGVHDDQVFWNQCNNWQIPQIQPGNEEAEPFGQILKIEHYDKDEQGN